MQQQLTLEQVNEHVLEPLQPPGPKYWLVMGILASVAGLGLLAWIYQVQMGMGVSGVNHPVGWASYITNFVFWVGIAHSGTLISAILLLVRAKWRTSVSRSAEAMTIFAIATAGLFPLIHLGRLWVVYYILPYPSQRQLWPNFQSPLVWDVVAISTYFTVSVIFFYVGLLPDLAAARDRMAQRLGVNHIRAILYRKLALGWSGSSLQWLHHDRAYLYFATLATPLVISVHSVVSWDFAMGLLPGWHVTLFAPYFVAGAIHSGLAMVLTLLIPMRKLLHLEKLIRLEHFEAVAITMLVTTSIIAYAYIAEPFASWYSNDIFEKQFAWWRATGPLAWMFWAIIPLNILVPLMFVFKKVRTNLTALLLVSILVNVGMWLERLLIIISAMWHDFLPHNWGSYWPRPVEFFIFFGAFAFFLICFFAFARLVPTVAITDVKKELLEENTAEPQKTITYQSPQPHTSGVLAVFTQPQQLIDSLAQLKESTYDQFETYTPSRIKAIETITGRHFSPVRFWTFIGALTGLVGGFALAIGTAQVNNLIVGGKHPVSIVPYCIVGFEGAILLGTLFNFAAMIFYTRLWKLQLPRHYTRQFSQDRFGLFVACLPQQTPALEDLLKINNPEAMYVYK